MSETRDELQTQARKIRDRIIAIEQREKAERAKALVGKCFRYRNCYSCPQKPSDYWWLYVRVDGVTRYGEVRMTSFQQDTHGDIVIKRGERGMTDLVSGGGGYQPITVRAFNSAMRKMRAKLADILKP